jgi:hypothetical protein
VALQELIDNFPGGQVRRKLDTALGQFVHQVLLQIEPLLGCADPAGRGAQQVPSRGGLEVFVPRDNPLGIGGPAEVDVGRQPGCALVVRARLGRGG